MYLLCFFVLELNEGASLCFPRLFVRQQTNILYKQLWTREENGTESKDNQK